MKVALIDVVYGHSSTGKIIEATHQHLLKTGHESRAFFGRGATSSAPHVKKIGLDLEILLDAGLSRLTGYSGIFSPIATARMMRELDKFRPDVVHVHELHGYYINYFELVEFLKARKIPVIWSLHCEHTYTGRCGNSLGCEQWKSHCTRCPRLDDYPASWLFDRSRQQFERKAKMFEGMERIIFAPVSNWLLSRVKESFLKNYPAQVVHNGVDTEKTFYPRAREELRQRYGLQGRHVVVSAAQDLMTAAKGGQWIIDLARNLQDKPISFLMIGMHHKMDMPPNVIPLPAIQSQDELAQHFSIADLFLITSQSETFSLVCAESLACGTPVVGFDSGGPGEVAPSPYGSFVPYGNLAALESTIIDIFEGTEQIADRQACRDHARLQFSIEHMIEGYLFLYREIMAPTPSIAIDAPV